MGYLLNRDGFTRVLQKLAENRRLYAPVNKAGEGRYTDVDVVRYDFITEAAEIELEKKSDYAFKEILTPLSETLFFFTENEVKEADYDQREVIVFLRSCDMHAVKRLDAIYLENKFADPFYKRIRDRVKFALIGCGHSYEDCFCASMGTNRTTEGYLFSVDLIDGLYHFDVKDPDLAPLFAAEAEKEQDVEARYVTENEVKVTIPADVPNSIYKDGLQTNSWERYSCRISNTLLSVGLSEDRVHNALVCIKEYYDTKYACQVPQNCFYAGNLLFPSEDRDISYDIFGACIGGELAAGCLEDKMPDVYEALCNNGTSVNVKCAVPFNDIINIHRNKVAFQFLRYYAAKSFWGIKYEIEFDCVTETDVPPDRILEIVPFIYVP